MAHIKYYFTRDKNVYEKTWEYNERLTWWVSFITNWFWFTDITELTSNKRVCGVGLNGYITLLSLLYISFKVLSATWLVNYVAYINILNFIIIFLLMFFPMLKLMFKLSGIFGIYYMFLISTFEPLFNNIFLDNALLFVLFILPGILFNAKYLEMVKKYKSFDLEKVEVSEYSLYYLYNRYIGKKSISQLENNLKNKIN